LSCSSEDKDKKALTFLVYMAADNSLTDFVFPDMSQMERANFDPDQVNVIVQADLIYYAEDSSCRRWQIMPDDTYDEIVTSPVIEQMGEIDTGDWYSLKEFYNWGVTNFPAENYILTIWSHGNDWYSYPATPNHFCPDNLSTSWFDIPGKDLQNAFQRFKVKPDLVIMDACHMQSLETVSEMADYANIVCGSTDTVPELGLPYNDVITSLYNDLPNSLNYGDIAQIYVDSYRPGGSQNTLGNITQPINMSVIESSIITGSIQPLVAEFVNYVLENEPDRELFLDIRSQCYEFNDLSMNIDLFQFVMKLNESDIDVELSDICSRLGELIFSDRDFYNYPSYYVGNIQVTFPKLVDLDNWNNLQDQYHLLDFDIMTNWSGFINWLMYANTDQS